MRIDLKNQGIDTTVKNARMGSDKLDDHILEMVDRHAKNSAKDLISLM